MKFRSHSLPSDSLGHVPVPERKRRASIHIPVQGIDPILDPEMFNRVPDLDVIILVLDPDIVNRVQDPDTITLVLDPDIINHIPDPDIIGLVLDPVLVGHIQDPGTIIVPSQDCLIPAPRGIGLALVILGRLKGGRVGKEHSTKYGVAINHTHFE